MMTSEEKKAYKVLIEELTEAIDSAALDYIAVLSKALLAFWQAMATKEQLPLTRAEIAHREAIVVEMQQKS